MENNNKQPKQPEDLSKDGKTVAQQATEPVSINDKDAVLVAKIDLRTKEAMASHKTYVNECNDDLKLFLGDHWEVALKGNKLPLYKSDVVVNKYFPGIRNLVALETDSKPQPATIPPGRDGADEAKKARHNAKLLDEMLDFLWDNVESDEHIGMPAMLQETYYDRYLYRDGYGRFFWNFETDDVGYEVVQPEEILFAPGSTSIKQSSYIIFQRNRTKSWIDENYPDKAEEVEFKSSKKADEDYKAEYSDEGVDNDSEESDKSIKDVVTVQMYVEDDLEITKAGKVILEKKENPLWERRQPWEQLKEWAYINSETFVKQVEEGIDIEAKDYDDQIEKAWQQHYDASETDPSAMAQINAMAKKDQGQEFELITNLWKRPQKPFVQFKGIKRSGQLRSDSIMKQLKKLAFSINLRKAQIDDNANSTGNPQKIIDPSVTEEEAKKWTSKPGLKVRINPAKARIEQAVPLPAYILQDLDHSSKIFDDILGHHEISRGGKSNQQTFGEASLLKEADQTPIRLYVRNNEKAITEILRGWVQLMKLFYDEKHYIGKIGTSEAEAYQAISRTEIDDGVKPRIKVGSTMPTSQAIKRQEYTQLFLANKLDPLTYYELMDFPNAEDTAKRLANWLKTMTISDDDQPEPEAQPGGGDILPPDEGGKKT